MTQDTLKNQVKSYLSDEKLNIQLQDLTEQRTRKYLDETTLKQFPFQDIIDLDENFRNDFIERLKRYEDCTTDIRTIMALVAHCGDSDYQRLIRNTLGRMIDPLIPEYLAPYKYFFTQLRWYPVILTSYAIGIAAISAENYSNLNVLLNAPVNLSDPSNLTQPLVLVLGKAISELKINTDPFNTNTLDPFKIIPGPEWRYTSRSEYLYKFLQPELDYLFFLGKDYERYFDEFEIMLALVHVDLSLQKNPNASGWGPVGRFGWKQGDISRSPFQEILKIAKQENTSWPPLKAGLFGGSYERFKIAAEKFQTSTLNRLNWR